ncbi:MAG: DUF6516 family protein [bacterium]|nr:DUF6516 family protein [bacterium]
MIQEYIEDIVEKLSISPVIKTFHVLRYRITDEEGHLRVKCNLLNNDIVEMNEYFQLEKDKIEVKTYSFHWQKETEELVKRWDNVPHHQEIDTFPNHIHIEIEQNVSSSEPMNFDKVLKVLESTVIPNDLSE